AGQFSQPPFDQAHFVGAVHPFDLEDVPPSRGPVLHSIADAVNRALEVTPRKLPAAVLDRYPLSDDIDTDVIDPLELTERLFDAFRAARAIHTTHPQRADRPVG